MTYGKHFSPASTPIHSPLPGRAADMTKNPDGAYVFKITDWEQLNRFLILGCVGGTYYAKEADLTTENAEVVLRCLKADGPRVVREIVRVSDEGLAPKNDPAIFALALASHYGEENVKQLCYQNLSKVCRIATHLFRFCEYRIAIGGGWGAGIRRAVSRWYRERSPEDLVYQALKYRQRNGWTHRDVLRHAHPVTRNEVYRLIYDAICAPEGGNRYGPGTNKQAGELRGVGRGWEGLRADFPVVDGYLKLKEVDPKNTALAAQIVSDHRLPFEMIPNEMLTAPEMWEAMLPSLGITAVLRNLGNMAKSGFLLPNSSAVKAVGARLTDVIAIQRGRVHPWNVCLASATFKRGHGFRGSGSWTVTPQIVDALEDTFEASFKNVSPTGKRFLLATDVSPSMSALIDGSPLSSAEAAAAMMLITLRTEENCYAFGFSHTFQDLKVSARSSLVDVMNAAGRYSRQFGSTDCAVPVRWALQNPKVGVDAIMVYTDNETNSGPYHAAGVAAQYRREVGPLKIGMVGFTATNRSIADPKDSDSMNFVGMDASLPAAISAFVRS